LLLQICRIKVANELREVVEQQQARLEQAEGHGHSRSALVHSQQQQQQYLPGTSPAKDARPHVAALQRLVADMRHELQKPCNPAGSSYEAAARSAREQADGHSMLQAVAGRNASWAGGSHAGTEAARAGAAELNAELREAQEKLRRVQAERDAALAGGGAEAAAAQLQLEHARK
jgi:hypothetical protein